MAVWCRTAGVAAQFERGEQGGRKQYANRGRWINPARLQMESSQINNYITIVVII